MIEIHASDLDNTYCYVLSNYLACLYKVVRNLLNYFFAFEEVNSLIFVDNDFFVKLKISTYMNMLNVNYFLKCLPKGTFINDVPY